MSAGTGCCVRLLLCTYVHTYLRTLTNGNIGSQPRLLFLSFFRKIHAAPDKYVRNLKEFVYRPHWARLSQSTYVRPMSLRTYVRTYVQACIPPIPPSPFPWCPWCAWCAAGGLVCLVVWWPSVPGVHSPHTYVRTYVRISLGSRLKFEFGAQPST